MNGDGYVNRDLDAPIDLDNSFLEYTGEIRQSVNRISAAINEAESLLRDKYAGKHMEDARLIISEILSCITDAEGDIEDHKRKSLVYRDGYDKILKKTR